jgi:hypothetical protein
MMSTSTLRTRLSVAAFACLSFFATAPDARAQCAAGQVEVFVEIATDNWGYELFWELLPGGNACGVGTVFAGGNPLVGCGGAGAQNQSPGGYGDNATVMEGPFCLTAGATYTIQWIDDWGDGGGNFTVYVDGLPRYAFAGEGASERWDFDATPAPARDVAILDLAVPAYTGAGSVDVAFRIRNQGATTLTSLDASWSVDVGSPEAGTISGLNVAPYAEATVTHPVAWSAGLGTFDLSVSVDGVNGGSDLDASNDEASKTVNVLEPVPNLVDVLLTAATAEVISSPSDNLDFPRDLDFHPDLSRSELWVINTNSASTGGSTVTYRDAARPGQTAQWLRDGNAWHFMSLPTGIAFSADNENFATSPGVFDANHDGGAPFTGPTLWSSDPAIYAQPSGGNGSHLDMLHESPLSQGIAWETGNVFWVADGHTGDVVRYDFVEDHGPGNSYHGDALVIRYPEVPVNSISDELPGHLVLDHASGWLYVINAAAGEVNRLDIESGVIGGAPAFAQTEPLAFYGQKTGCTVESVVTGLSEPVGIEVIEDRLLVSEHATGEVVVYDLSAPGFPELGRIATPADRIMGIRIGPEGHLWYTDAGRNEVVRMTAPVSGLAGPALSGLTVGPSPSTGEGYVRATALRAGTAELTVVDAAGRVALRREADVRPGQALTLPLQAAPGLYTVALRLGDAVQTARWVVVE